MSGITYNIEDIGKTVLLTCTINRMKPKAAEIYWTINGRRENGTLSSEGPDYYGVHSQTITFDYT